MSNATDVYYIRQWFWYVMGVGDVLTVLETMYGCGDGDVFTWFIYIVII